MMTTEEGYLILSEISAHEGKLASPAEGSIPSSSFPASLPDRMGPDVGIQLYRAFFLPLQEERYPNGSCDPMSGEIIFRTPITFGWDVFDELPEHIPQGNIMLILGRGSADRLKLKERIGSMMAGEMAVFSGVEPNPSSATVERGAREIRENDPDIIIAAGGGSVMDAAKFMSLIAVHGGTVMDYITGKRTPPDGGLPVYAIPTTPGTSSEITPFTVVTDDRIGNKVGLRHPSLFPRGAIIDPSLTVSLPPRQTAATGLDILSHAVESFWSRNATPLTREFSLRSVSLVREHLQGAYDDGASRPQREGISLASVLAGMAFSNTGTTICHSISYPITYDSGLPHGMAVALSLGPAFELLRKKGFEGLRPLAEAFGSNTRNFRKDLESFMRSIGSPTTLEEAGFTGGEKRIMDTDMTALLRNFPVSLDEGDLEWIIRAIS